MIIVYVHSSIATHISICSNHNVHCNCTIMPSIFSKDKATVIAHWPMNEIGSLVAPFAW